MNALKKPALQALPLLALLTAGAAHAAGGDVGQAAKQATNWTAIIMFGIFVAGTLWITKWAAAKTRSAADFYTAGGGITGFQNGLAIAGDYMSAASFLGISAAVMATGYDGLIYSIGFLVGWPIITFLMAERLRNLGKFTFADIVSYRLDQNRIRTFAAIGSLTVVCFYLIVQMVGAGQLIQLLFGLEYNTAVAVVGILMMVYVTFGGMVATTWVQIIKACMLLAGGTLVMLLAMSEFGFSFTTLLEKATSVHKLGDKLMYPGALLKDPVTAISLGLGLMFGTAGLPHILMRFFTVTDAKEARKSVLYASGFVGYFFNVIFIMGLTAIIIASSSGENCTHIEFSFSTPTPCSPVIVPPISTLSSRISAPKASARRSWSGSLASKRISGCRLPSPAWKTLQQRRPCLSSIAAIARSMSARRRRGMVESMHM